MRLPVITYLLPFLMLVSDKEVHSTSVDDAHPLLSAVRYFDTLHKVNDVRHHDVRRRRSGGGGGEGGDASFLSRPPNVDDHEPKLVEFNTLGRHFKLLLRPHTEPFHPRSHVQYGTSGAKVPIDVHQFHHGHVIGSEGASHVIAHITTDGILTAVIMADNDWYYIEPSSRHFKESHDFHMISYRGSDLKFNATSRDFCGVTESDNDHHHNNHHGDWNDRKILDSSTESQSDDERVQFSSVSGDKYFASRLKRQTGAPKASSVCPVKLVGTTSLYEILGQSNVDHAINYLLVVFLQIDNIFRSTDWHFPGVSGSASPGVRGLQVADIMIFNTTEGSPEYNGLTSSTSPGKPWGSSELLDLFTQSDWSDYCLAHLFTARSFSDSHVLGVANRALPNSIHSGGICSRKTRRNGINYFDNAGLSTYWKSGRPLLLAESIVVTGHEIGHSWGSTHDLSTNECSPPFGRSRGKYLMYASAQDGQSRNNMIFSNCSRRAISKILRTHESFCFEEPYKCGNYIIDDGEECDPGPTRVLQGGDKCCNADCTFKTNSDGVKYTCSDANVGHSCCSECFPSPIGTVCHEEQPENFTCFANRTCNGDITCPTEPSYQEEGTDCGILGLCVAEDNSPMVTTCSNFCELRNLTTCFCTDASECFVCCKGNSTDDASCALFGDSTVIPLPAGQFCEGGTCNGQGTCVLSSTDRSRFLDSLFTSFTISSLERNIVGLVLFFSLLLWIPLPFIIHLRNEYNADGGLKKILCKRQTDEVGREEEEESLLSLHLSTPDENT